MGSCSPAPIRAACRATPSGDDHTATSLRPWQDSTPFRPCGDGQTGSSSIQETLKAGRAALWERGVAYLGLMLEYAGPQRCAWQSPTGSDAFFTSSDPAAQSEALYGLLVEALDALSEAGIVQAIWSNEWIFKRSAFVLPALRRLRAEGYDIRIVCYLRRIDGWMRSAYVQWGIKEKSNRGPVQPFGQWARHRSFALREDAEIWAEAFGPRLLLRNFDAIPDVVTDFLQEFAVEAGLQRVRDNDRPYPSLLAAWLAFNSGFTEPVRPSRFTEAWRHTGLLQAPPLVPRLEDVMPSAADLAAIRETYAADTAALNTMLEAQGQQPFDLTQPLREAPLPTEAEMQAMLLRMVFTLQQEVEELRRTVAGLQRGPG